MIAIYLDNFRGFDDTILPIKDVNFFVGENSTGKTSILSLIKLLSEEKFWNVQDFNLDDIEFGFFNEIVNPNFPEKQEFTIGVLSENLFIRLSFIQENNHPRLKEVNTLLLLAFINIKIFLNREGTYCKHQKFDHINDKESLFDLFRLWTKQQTINNTLPIKLEALARYRALSILDVIYYAYQQIRIEYKLSKYQYRQAHFVIIDLLPPLAWIAPIRAEPKRTYESFKRNFSSSGEHIPYVLRTLFTQIKENKHNQRILNQIESFGKQSGLFDSIEIKTLGEDITAPFTINVIRQGISYKISNVGYGVSQSLPVLVEVLNSKNRWFAIQQPEVHLHPKAQAALGEFIFENAKKLIGKVDFFFKSQRKKFLLETHSDFLIDRFRSCMNNNYQQQEKNPTAQVVFFEKTPTGNQLHCIDITETGAYSDNQPDSFRAFFINEELDLLRI